MSDSSNRCRVWTFVAYPDSVPANWEGILNDLHISWAHSPLHDSDLNADDSEKKPHWHCFIEFDGVKSYEQVKEITSKINATIPQRVRNVRMLFRYFVHLDNPEKTQYNVDDIYSYGIDIEPYFALTSSSEDLMLCDILKYIDDNQIFYYSEFLRCCSEFHKDWFGLIIRKFSFVVSLYIKDSRLFNKENEEGSL